jgi:hypothetical protein
MMMEDIASPVTESALVEDTDPTPWTDARTRIETPEPELPYWLATVSPDGRPHIRPILGLWLKGTFRFVISTASLKGRNLAADPRCSLAGSRIVPPSLDFILEGNAHELTDKAEVLRVVDAFGSKMQWPLEYRDGGIFGPNAPTAGSPPYAAFELMPTTVFGLPGVAGMEEGPASFTPTRWRFSFRRGSRDDR